MTKVSTANQAKEISVDQGPLNESRDLVPVSELKLEICQNKAKSSVKNVRSSFKQLIDDVILSCSPFIKFELPTLMKEDQEDLLRVFLPEGYMDYLKSNMIVEDSTAALRVSGGGGGFMEGKEPARAGNELSGENLHEFLLMQLTKSFHDLSFKRNYADYKSRGRLKGWVLSVYLTFMRRLRWVRFKNAMECSENKFCLYDFYDYFLH